MVLRFVKIVLEKNIFQFSAVWIFRRWLPFSQSCSAALDKQRGDQKRSDQVKRLSRMNNEPAPENAAGGGAVAVAAGAGGGGDETGNVAAAIQENQDGNDGIIEANVEISNGNQNGEETMDTENTTVAPPASRYSLRKRKPLLAVKSGNAAAATGSNSNSAVPAAATADPFGYVNTANLTDRQFEKMLAKYEEDGVRERAQKKLRLERGYGDDDYPYEAPPEGCPPFSSLPKECIQLVFEFLPSVRSVFNLAFQSKYMLSFVEERVSRYGVACNFVTTFFITGIAQSSPFLLRRTLSTSYPFSPRPTLSFGLSSMKMPATETRTSSGVPWSLSTTLSMIGPSTSQVPFVYFA